MKHIPTALAFIATLCFVSGTPIYGQSNSPGWSATLLDQIFHVGDDQMKAFAKPRPNGNRFKGTFTLPANVPHSLSNEFVIRIEVADMVSPKERQSKIDLRNGIYQTRLLLNGKEIAVLNDLIKIPERAQSIAPLSITVRGTVLAEGENVIEIIPGGNHNNLDDFELHLVSIESKTIR